MKFHRRKLSTSAAVKENFVDMMRFPVQCYLLELHGGRVGGNNFKKHILERKHMKFYRFASKDDSMRSWSSNVSIGLDNGMVVNQIIMKINIVTAYRFTKRYSITKSQWVNTYHWKILWNSHCHGNTLIVMTFHCFWWTHLGLWPLLLIWINFNLSIDK